MKLIGVVVTYFPELEMLKKNISSYISDLDHLIIWENTPSGERNYSCEEIKKISGKITFAGVGENVGIGKALNFGVNCLLSNDFDFLITFDQDSYFAPGMLERYKEKISKNENPNIGIFGVNYTAREKLAYKNDNENTIMLVKECITSGSAFPRSTFEKGLLFDEELFIDAVDFDFCYKANKKYALQTVILTDIILNHKIGYSENTLKGRISDNYSAFRTFYLIKNQIYIWRRYPHLYPIRKKKHLIVKYIGLRYISVLLFEEDKFAKLKSISKGILFGISKKI
ncbi:hypothetical protein LUD75_01880 [Epilithonimonas sp. JDS]|uniref:glycosyltransferase n=1 Tax=Epilithonimonas sp. JDS TaxID=2902797 RepID=UPI001E34014E|nr:glycosyltransferase [Epilithonimonas sp. JDS]MCD9853437.1 hypothetical protein [Epilithonimonas sp. JDS]